MARRTKKCLLEESGVSEVVGVILIIGMIVVAFSAFYPLWRQSEIHRLEAEHMSAIRANFLELKSKVEDLVPGDSASVSLKLGRDTIWFGPDSQVAPNLSGSPASLRTVRVYPDDDGYVSENLPQSNFGTDTLLQVASKEDNDRRAFLKFSLENIPTGGLILKADLWLYCESFERPLRDVTDIKCYPVDNDDWSEDNLTWENQPIEEDKWISALDSTFVDKSGWISVTAKDFVALESTGDKKVTLALRTKYENYDGFDRYVSFSSKEDPDENKKPYLEITYTVSPASWVQTDWSGGLRPGPEVGEWGTEYRYYYTGLNVDTSQQGEIRLAAGALAGYLESSIYDAGGSVEWGRISWEAITPSDSVFENFYVQSESVTEGGTVDFDNSRTDDGNYENIYEDVAGWPSSIILLWDDSYGPVPDGWECISDDPGEPFYQRFPRGATSYGGSGGSETHTHGYTRVSGGPNPTRSLRFGLNFIWLPSSTHTHPATVSISENSHVPLYYTLKVIKYAGGPKVIPEDAIAIFDATPPDGWTPLYYGERYIRGDVTSGNTGGSATHAHHVVVTYGESSPTPHLLSTGSTEVADGVHTHEPGETMTAENTNEPPYIKVILARADADTTVPAGMIAMFDSAPDGAYWELLSNSGGPFEGRLIRSSSFYGETGGRTGDDHPNVTVTSGPPTPTQPLCRTGGLTITTGAHANHTHADTISFEEAEILPPYRDVIFAKSRGPMGFQMDVQHTIGTGVETFDTYELQLKYYTGGDSEQISVLIYDFDLGDWVFAGNLQAGGSASSPFGTQISLRSANISAGGEVWVRYTQLDEDQTMTSLMLDYSRVQASTIIESSTTVDVRTGETVEDLLESEWLPCANGGDIPMENRYIQYRVVLQRDAVTVGPVFREIAMNCLKAGPSALPYGGVEFIARNEFFPSQTYVYEAGGVILIQGGVDLMVSGPQLVAVSDAGGGITRVEFDLWVIKSGGGSTASTGTATIRATCKSSRYVVAPVEGPNREEVSITVSSTRNRAWGDYLEDLCRNLPEWCHAECDGETLTIKGVNEGSGADILYYEKLHEIEIAIS